MRSLLLCCLLVLLAFAPDSGSSAGSLPPPGGPFAAQWRQIDRLLAQGRTATAAPLVAAIYRQARQRGATPDYVRALLYQVRRLQAREENADEQAIALLEKDLRTATFPARPILHSLLAELYTRYLNQNRYRLYDRTAGAAPATGVPTPPTGAKAGTSLATWDLGRLGAAIVRHYYQSVEDEPRRQLATLLAELGDLAAGGDAEGRARRPTLYDLLAQRAIAGLQNQELSVTRPEAQFQLTEPRLFGPATEFAALRLLAPTADSLHGELHALRLLQRLTAARQQLAPLTPARLAALADVDLLRLDFLRRLTENTALAARYEPALARLAETYKSLPLSTEFLARQAEARREADPVAAVALARQAEARFPKSRGAARARQLRQQIQRPELAFSASDIVLPNQPWRLDVTARNVTELHARAYRISVAQSQSFRAYETRLDDDQPRYRRWLRAAPTAAWTVPVPPQLLNYQAQKLAVAGPALPVGHYLVVISHKIPTPLGQPQPGAATAYAVLGASELSALSRRDPGPGALQLLTLHRQTGTPLAGVRAQATYARYDRRAQREVRRSGGVGESGASGEVAVPAPASGSGSEPNSSDERIGAVRVWRGPDTLALGNAGGYYEPNRSSSETQRQAFLFTDRAIYRPGQTLYFKGILTESQRGKARLLPGQPLSARLTDVNGQTVQTLPFTTSEFGSFHGSLVLPAGLLNGGMSLQTDHGTVSFAVEDYKRPTFRVQLDSVPGRPQLGQPLSVMGRARAYAGPATDGAQVSYRVTRRALWPLIDYERFSVPGRFVPPRGGRESQEIAHGTTTTDAEGRFVIRFTPPLLPAAPGRRGGGEPGYLFEITADVTDAAGETRTGTRSFPIGRNPLSLLLIGPGLVDKRRAAEFTLLSSNATDEPLNSSGILRVLARQPRPAPPGVPAGRRVDDDDRNTAAPEPPPILVKTLGFDTKNSATLRLRAALADLPTGRYRLEAQTVNPDTASDYLNFVLYDSEAATVPFDTPDWFVAHGDTTNPNKSYVLIGSRDADAHVLLETERGGHLLRREWLTLRANEQRRIQLDTGAVAGVGPLHVHTTQVRDNQLYRHEAQFETQPRPRPLRLAISTFRDKLLPGEQETWRLTIRQANGQPADAELLATLYDQSLDVFRPHGFRGLEVGGGYYPARLEWQGEFREAQSTSLATIDERALEAVEYPELTTWEEGRKGGRGWPLARRTLSGRVSGVQLREAVVVANASLAAPAPIAAKRSNEEKAAGFAEAADGATAGKVEPSQRPVPTPDLTFVPTRRDFRETAFWQPALRTDKNGDIVLEFQLPEAVTRWQLLALAHDKSLRSGQLARQLVTQKQVQITANAPRFFRLGDSFRFQARFSNLTDQSTSGTAQLFLLDAASGQDITGQLLKSPAQQAVAAGAHQSAAVGWDLSLPPDFRPTAVTYRVVAQSQLAASKEQLATKKSRRQSRAAALAQNRGVGNEVSDGEENTLPVLPNRILITESLPLTLAGAGTRTFELSKLTSTSSPTRRSQRLTLELTTNPAWLAVQSLPYLMEYPYEGSEQIFSRLYANLIAAHLLRANPRLPAVLAEWQRQAQSGSAAQQNALASKLAQNQELKSLLLQEMPWVRDAQAETQRLAHLAALFDQPRLAAETARALAQLQRMQLPSGAWPWFEQMPADRYLTQFLVAGLGRLRRLGVFDAGQDAVAQGILQNALRYLDAQLAQDYAALRQTKNFKPTDNHLGDLAVQALYARSFWPEGGVGKAAQPAYTFFRQQAATHWLRQPRQLQAQLALAAFRTEGRQSATAATILRALRENALHAPELGMYWQQVRGGYSWREAPTETQSVLIEAFAEVAQDQQSVEEMKLWLLRQKQVQSWASTRATADACYALLLRGADLLAPAAPLQVVVGPENVAFSGAQAGTGYVKTTWPAAVITPAQGRVSITKTDPGTAWGALYWQYFEDLDQVTPAATPLSIERQLYRETRTAGGPVLAPLTSSLPPRVGETVVVRLVLRTDRRLEYVHLKDQRAAGLEPLAPTSGYRYQGGLGYYESPRDAANSFFFSELPPGTHVLEYRLRAAQAGDFSGGLSQVQCLYAPEFGATSAGGRLRVGP